MGICSILPEIPAQPKARRPRFWIDISLIFLGGGALVWSLASFARPVATLWAIAFGLVALCVIPAGVFIQRQALTQRENARLRATLAAMTHNNMNRASAEAALRTSEALNRGVLNALPAQIAVLDATGTIMTVNSTWQETAAVCGDPRAARTGIGSNYLEVCRQASADDYDAALVLKGLEAILYGEQPLFTYEYPCETPEGLCWYLLYVTPLQRGAVMAHFDITDRKLLEQRHEALIAQLHDQAQTDSLTGLANRRAFMEGAERAWNHAQRVGQSLGVILLDVDHFKQVNDTYGHQAGDHVLRELALRCRASVRGMDLIGRYGGEEFAIVMPGLTYGGALQIAERLRESIASAPIGFSGQSLHPTVSVGVVVGQPPSESLEMLLAAADSALYAAKRGGRNRVVASRGAVATL